MKKRVRGKIDGVKLIVYDFDGVLTDNKVILREDGMESVVVNRADGMAIAIIKRAGIEQLILTSEKNRLAAVRAKKLGIPVRAAVADKKKALTSYCDKRNIPLRSVIYVGNDLNDYEAMLLAGCPVCPSDASPEIMDIARLVLRSAGGEGAVRELVRHINVHSRS